MKYNFIDKDKLIQMTHDGFSLNEISKCFNIKNEKLRCRICFFNRTDQDFKKKYYQARSHNIIGKANRHANRILSLAGELADLESIAESIGVTRPTLWKYLKILRKDMDFDAKFTAARARIKEEIRDSGSLEEKTYGEVYGHTWRR